MEQQTSSQASILVVDDEEPIRNLVKRAVEGAGFRCSSVPDGKKALALLEENKVDVVITDIKMPELDGIRLTQEVKEHYDTDVIVMTGYVEDFTYDDVILKGASDFIQKPVDMKELVLRLKRVLRERELVSERNQAEAELKQSFDRLSRVLNETVNSLGSALAMKDPYTAGHQQRVTQLACALSREMGFSRDQIEGIRTAGLLHDIGKISIPVLILNKPGRLNVEEFNLIKLHPRTGSDIIKEIEFDQPVAQIILQHHERMNGSGYPQGLSGEKILLESRILAVADVIEAMASHRPYRPSLGVDKALEEVKRGRGELYDPRVVDTCLKLFAEHRFSHCFNRHIDIRFTNMHFTETEVEVWSPQAKKWIEGSGAMAPIGVWGYGLSWDK